MPVLDNKMGPYRLRFTVWFLSLNVTCLRFFHVVERQSIAVSFYYGEDSTV